MFIKLIIILFIIAILFCLGGAGVLLVKKQHSKEAMVKALTWRIGLSVFLFILLLVSFWLGWLTPQRL